MNRNDENDMKELSEVLKLEEEIRVILATCLTKKSRDDSDRLQEGKSLTLSLTSFLPPNHAIAAYSTSHGREHTYSTNLPHHAVG